MTHLWRNRTFYSQLLWRLNALLSSRFTIAYHSSLRLPFRRHALLRLKARSFTYLMYCSLPRSSRALPDNEKCGAQCLFVINEPGETGLILNVLWRLNALLSSQFTIAYNLSLPGLFRAIQLKNSAALAAIISAAKPPVFFSMCFWHLNVLLSSQFTVTYHSSSSPVGGNPDAAKPRKWRRLRRRDILCRNDEAGSVLFGSRILLRRTTRRPWR